MWFFLLWNEIVICISCQFLVILWGRCGQRQFFRFLIIRGNVVYDNKFIISFYVLSYLWGQVGVLFDSFYGGWIWKFVI